MFQYNYLVLSFLLIVLCFFLLIVLCFFFFIICVKGADVTFVY